MDFETQRRALGSFIRSQRELANLSLRQMANLAEISNPYLSQIERGLHQPSVQVLRSIATALNLSAETLLSQAGLLDRSDRTNSTTQEAIRADERLTAPQKQALLAVYRSYCEANEAAEASSPAGDPVAGDPVAGDPVAGDPVAGAPVAGDPVAGAASA